MHTIKAIEKRGAVINNDVYVIHNTQQQNTAQEVVAIHQGDAMSSGWRSRPVCSPEMWRILPCLLFAPASNKHHHRGASYILECPHTDYE
ncbi:hypothetical protein GDO78_022487 [Eleutherodactylus coqui]|uniref:Uncharacterized protein n=1 Tax=Eleutherodactylus coqui TaxID=57060 RepID=A0A8J6BML3_ELECQ|nr:hypothetical protein GDO78_022487 [Eleutherodactylus coqui]